MQTRIRTVLFLFILIISSPSCKIHKTIDFETNKIFKIEIAEIRTVDKSNESFKEIILFIEDQKEGWEIPHIGTFPTPKYTIIFYDENGFAYSLFIGNNWIGTSYNGNQYIKKKDIYELNNFLKKINLNPI